MSHRLVLAVAAVALLACASVGAVGRTTRILIKADILATPIEIANPDATSRFNVWNGPGAGSEGFIIDWRSGPVTERPSGLRRYEVSFYVNHRTQPPHVEDLAYVVFYVYDPVTAHGLVYLPGKNDPEWTLNVFSIYHGVEGNWFRPTPEWERIVNPLIARAESATVR